MCLSAAPGTRVRNAYLYLRGVLTLERERNFKNMARRLGNGEDGQA